MLVRSERQLADQASTRLGSVLVLFYGLLAMSAVMALLGMLYALTLSINERTRELGTLRALGMTRAQARALIRDEGLITAATGTLVGAALGLGLGWLMTRALAIPLQSRGGSSRCWSPSGCSSACWLPGGRPRASRGSMCSPRLHTSEQPESPGLRKRLVQVPAFWRLNARGAALAAGALADQPARVGGHALELFIAAFS